MSAVLIGGPPNAIRPRERFVDLQRHLLPDVDKGSDNALEGESPKAPSRRFSVGYPRGPNRLVYLCEPRPAPSAARAV